jgi:hypothetical protein
MERAILTGMGLWSKWEKASSVLDKSRGGMRYEVQKS